jgi:hypothetical protein
LIFYEDPDCETEVFTDESAARKRFEQASVSWSCHLFCSADLPARDEALRIAVEGLEFIKKGLCYPDEYRTIPLELLEQILTALQK